MKYFVEFASEALWTRCTLRGKFLIAVSVFGLLCNCFPLTCLVVCTFPLHSKCIRIKLVLFPLLLLYWEHPRAAWWRRRLVVPDPDCLRSLSQCCQRDTSFISLPRGPTLGCVILPILCLLPILFLLFSLLFPPFHFWA